MRTPAAIVRASRTACAILPFALGLLIPAVSPALASQAQAGRIAVDPASAVTIDTLALRSDTRVLAADSMGGRGLGSSGARMAAEFIRSRLLQIGVDPGPNGFFEEVPVRRARLDPQSAITLAAGPDTARFSNGRDFVIETGSGPAFDDFSGKAIFAGTSATALRTLQRGGVEGKVIVIAGPLDEDADSLVRFLESSGAAAILQLVPDSQFIAGLDASLGNLRYWVDRDVDEPRWQATIPRIACGPRLSRALLALTPLPAGALQGSIDAGIDLSWDVKARIVRRVDTVPASNVVGWIPGTDSPKAGGIVLFTAHYDHLGTDGTGPDTIYNGFSDNAAGVAMLLAIAGAIHTRPWSRPVGFVFMTGEESGLLGSSSFAASPAWPLADIRAVINLDGGAPPRPPVAWRLAGLPESTLSLLADSVVRASGWVPSRTGTRANSDHWPFLARGVASLFIIPGNEWEKTSAAEHDALREKWDHYHQPADEWKPDFPFAGLARYAFLALRIGRVVSDMH
jgi:Peptidase family M28